MASHILSYFEDIVDPRLDRHQYHSMNEILFVILVGCLCGQSHYTHISDFGDAHIEWFRRYFRYAYGIPSHDTLGRLMRLICPKEFRDCFMRWTESLSGKVEGVVSIDGKALRRSFDGEDRSNMLTMVSAWSHEAGLVIGQQKVKTGSNEITALPALISLLDLKGCLVTIDAMGCQHEVLEQITASEGEYLVSLKGNQGRLHQDVQDFYAEEENITQENSDIFEEIGGDHGRIETRKATIVTDIDWLIQRHPQFKTIKSIVKLETQREFKNKPNKKIEHQTRYFISSRVQTADKMLHNCRNHWHIENKLHWSLDVTFMEDQSRIRKDNAPENMAIVRHIAINAIHKFKEKNNSKKSIKRIQNECAWKNAQRDNIIKQLF